MSTHYEPETLLGRAVHDFEETVIAVLLGLMTAITFVNVVLRYGFNTGLIWGLEATTFLFAWLVLFGISHAVKVTAHLGVDAVINAVNPRLRRGIGVLAGLICMAYAFLLLKGAWDYWANFANLPQTTGRWFPTGLEEMTRTSFRGWYEVVDVPMPEFLRFIEPLMNDGESYEKLPRFIPYAILPVGMALLLLRFTQATLRLLRGDAESLIVSHEAEDAVEDVARMNRED
ncbi:TRAP transporter permease DctQ [Maritimibacter sp. 55A14]|uniref:TRAP transporter small permease n=1 Tax=Maritimibacter sp. 55A14 TaxID=2174844 RepID=UPI000D60E064|nr:TRAP transporter small permease [Maritimibacter sp. 55A14]PWE32583.1 TRAP transporter permease DctQ [Maritimibacter sp. 55A14]